MGDTNPGDVTALKLAELVRSAAALDEFTVFAHKRHVSPVGYAALSRALRESAAPLSKVRVDGIAQDAPAAASGEIGASPSAGSTS